MWTGAAFQFAAAMAVTQLGWTTPYSLLGNAISDLGAVHCGAFPPGSAHYVCSPWHEVVDASAVVLGLLSAAGVALNGPAFPARRVGLAGRILAAVAAAGAVGVGLSPEDVNRVAHGLFALLAFVPGNAALIVLGLAAPRNWEGRFVRFLGAAGGTLGLFAFGVYAFGAWGPLGSGGTERLIVAPELLWVAVAGVWVYRSGLASTPSRATACASGAGLEPPIGSTAAPRR